MRSNKRKRATIHPRNRYADNPPDFALLASLYPSFSPYVTYSRDGRPRIDWTDFNATRELTRVLLHRDHALNWWIPDGQLCPTVPNRSNYIHWIEDLVASDIVAKQNSAGDQVRGFDIGTGANCIYPLLGASLLGWSFVGSDVADIAIEWAEKNVQSNPHIASLIEIRRVDNVSASKGNSTYPRGSSPEKASLSSNETGAVEDLETFHHDKTLDDSGFLGCVDKAVFSEMNNGDIESKPPSSLDERATGGSYQGPPILLGVVKDEEKFDFCMCNPPFFESMEEAGLNPKTSCGGTIQEMVCTGGERAFISRIIEDSIVLRQKFRWYTSMLGKKSNMKFLTSKLRKAGVTVVKTTEFVQGQTSRWGLAWSFMGQMRKLLPPLVPEKSNFSFLLEHLHRQVSAVSILQSVESFFCSFGATCKSNPSSFTVDVTTSNENWDLMLKNSNNIDDFQHVTEVPRIAGHVGAPSNQLCFRLSVYQQIPGVLLVKGSLQPKNGPASGMGRADQQGVDEVGRWFNRDFSLAAQKVSHLHFYLHDIATGDHPSAVKAAESSITKKFETGFGIINVVDDRITVSPDPESQEIGRAQGVYGSSDQKERAFITGLSFVFSGESSYNSSTLTMLGRNPILRKNHEVPIVGGTGFFRLARGVAVVNTITRNPVTKNAVVEYDVFVLHF